MRGIVGILVLLLLAWAMSEDRWRVPWRAVVGGVALQFVLAVVLLHLPGAASAFLLLNRGVEALQAATDQGTRFIFGYLGGGATPWDAAHPEAGFILAFQALPLVLVISALASVLFYWGILQRIVAGFAWCLRRSMGVGGALGLGAAVHVFVGMTESPLLIRPYLKGLSRGEMFALMSCGMAGIAGTVMVIYATLLKSVVPDSLANILIAGVISTPAALAVAGLMIPFRPDPEGERHLSVPHPPSSTLDAIVKGTFDGVPLLVGIVIMLLVMVTLVSLLNMTLGLLPHWGDAPMTIQRILAWGFRPLVWLIGVPWEESETAAALMGTKTVLTEFAAYIQFSQLPPEALSPRSRLIMTYALCGFANCGSVGILVGGVGVMVPDRRAEIVELGLRSLVSGTIATMTSGAVAGML
ncbi:MAG TPA: nucleoside transporter C-terminal domain-containing protein [Stellaceae bacterium]|nr:nucleoside transporter C-terminal domain-containing protein [Stellaceae bacterium]